MAVVFKGNSEDMRNAQDIWNGSPLECYEMTKPDGILTVPVAQFDVMSNEAVYSKIVVEGEGCPLN